MRSRGPKRNFVAFDWLSGGDEFVAATEQSIFVTVGHVP